MDYGKLAYLKAEDIEGRLRLKKNTQYQKRILNEVLNTQPMQLFEVSGGVIIVEALFYATGGRVALVVNGNEITEKNIDSRSIIFMHRLFEKSTIGLKASGSPAIISADIVAFDTEDLKVL